MKWSIENRSPFLDTRLFKYIFIDEIIRYKRVLIGYLEKSLQKNCSKILWRKDKQGRDQFSPRNF